MNQRVVRLLSASLAVFSFIFTPLLHAAENTKSTNPIKVVYHIDDTTRASALLKNVQNNLEAVPGTKITVVAHGKGIDFMLNNAQDANGNPYNVMMETLAQQGVEFKICNNTLKSRHLTAADVAYPVTIVPAGIAEIARLQAQEGYVYVKP
ncbi:DsrE family protein [Sulfuriferula nivalis]|uniref:DsrE family protein n=1 Tax=Sulfuriferula nivalis TaxID=2675298 RepID=A0A809RTZ6_9PROT|nr:DsrE family protein [Sulfuriferula nivalis]BBP02381.1 hypothetical protein SFSGTM_30890 [Sulfuriferula nivalis]